MERAFAGDSTITSLPRGVFGLAAAFFFAAVPEEGFRVVALVVDVDVDRVARGLDALGASLPASAASSTTAVAAVSWSAMNVCSCSLEMRARQDRILARQCPYSRRIRRAGIESIDGDRPAFHRMQVAIVAMAWSGFRIGDALAMSYVRWPRSEARLVQPLF
ncbi:MAG: hypothetical protein ACTHQE_03690 [Thermomicrobiales bacterium]